MYVKAAKGYNVNLKDINFYLNDDGDWTFIEDDKFNGSEDVKLLMKFIQIKKSDKKEQENRQREKDSEKKVEKLVDDKQSSQIPKDYDINDTAIVRNVNNEHNNVPEGIFVANSNIKKEIENIDELEPNVETENVEVENVEAENVEAENVETENVEAENVEAEINPVVEELQSAPATDELILSDNTVTINTVESNDKTPINNDDESAKRRIPKDDTTATKPKVIKPKKEKALKK